MKITIKNIIKESKDIDPKQKYVNGIIKMIRPPYFRFLKVNEIPKELWEGIFSKLFNRIVTYSDKRIFYIRDSNNNNVIYFEDSNGFWSKYEYDSNNNKIYYEDSDGEIMDNRTSNPINENTDPKQRYVNGILNMIRRPYMEFLINNEVPEELWKDILSKIFNTNDIFWEIESGDDNVLNELTIRNEKGKLLYYETQDYWEQLIYGYHNRLDMDFTWYVNSVGSKKVTLIGKHSPIVYSNGPTGYSWSGLSDDIKNNKFFDLNY